MKKIFTLIAVLFSITTFAAEYPAPKTSKISIVSNNRSIMQVKIDGVTYNLNNTFVLDNIRSGNHSITIFKSDNFGFRKRTQVVYNGSLFISPAQLVNININRTGQVMVSQSSMDRFNRDDRFKNNDWKNNDRNYDNRNYDNRDYDNRNDHYGKH